MQKYLSGHLNQIMSILTVEVDDKINIPKYIHLCCSQKQVKDSGFKTVLIFSMKEGKTMGHSTKTWTSLASFSLLSHHFQRKKRKASIDIIIQWFVQE